MKSEKGKVKREKHSACRHIDFSLFSFHFSLFI